MLDYFPSGGGRGRVIEKRFGLVGRAFRAETSQTDGDIPPTIEELVLHWGMTVSEATRAGRSQHSFSCVLLKDETTREPVAGIYVDSVLSHAFGPDKASEKEFEAKVEKFADESPSHESARRSGARRLQESGAPRFVSTSSRVKVMSSVEIGDYTALASEYYDSARHPTSANFHSRVGSVIMNEWLKSSTEPGLIIDVGAGDSLVATLLHAWKRSLTNLLLVDSSTAMLAYSKRWLDFGARAEVADAADLPVASRSARLIVASLGDPYNTPAFWKEARRVLEPNGCVIFTTPAHQWAARFRRISGEPADSAEFALATAEKCACHRISMRARSNWR